jgi:hypothetical protein
MTEVLRAVPDVGSNYTVFDRGGTPLARVAPKLPGAKLEVGGTRYEVRRKGWAGKEFILETEDGRVVAMIEKPSVWRNRFVLEHGGNQYELKWQQQSFWGGAFVLFREGVGPVGSVRSEDFTREWIGELPEELPLEVRVFIVSLRIILWKRAASASAAAGGAAAAGG